MRAFEYANPTTVKEAATLLGSSWDEAAVLAGGTDLISLMKDEVYSPKRVVNIKNIKELGGIGRSGGNVRLGATVTFDDFLNHAVSRELTALADAARGVTSPQIRNMGTVAGDLTQRPRCWYYRQGHGLLAMQNGKSLVPDGENRYHAIFPAGQAYFVSASSLGPALIALGAKLKVASATGTREVAAEKFFVAPQDANSREVDLKPNEIVTEILIPSDKTMKSATYEVRERAALDWPVAAASVALKMNGNTVQSARVVLGHVGPTPHIAAEAERMLAGKTISAAIAEQAGAAAVAGAKPLSQNAYKVQLAKVAVKRALMQAAGVKA
jgi:xanthine dehydrogenase YagS FAD-binding subunit